MILRKGGFTFKRFFVGHDRCAMKVTTDSIILGAWAGIQHSQRLLDIGAGSGLLALMLAQRTQPIASIDAVEVDPLAAEQARENIRQSPWPDKVFVHQAAIQHFSKTRREFYHVIVSNPPYFIDGPDCRDAARNTARYTQTLSHIELLKCVVLLLDDSGQFNVVLPALAVSLFEQQAASVGLFSVNRLWVADTFEASDHLVCLRLMKKNEIKREETPIESRLIIRHKATREYTADFQRLTQAFYLAF